MNKRQEEINELKDSNSSSNHMKQINEIKAEAWRKMSLEMINRFILKPKDKTKLWEEVLQDLVDEVGAEYGATVSLVLTKHTEEGDENISIKTSSLQEQVERAKKKAEEQKVEQIINVYINGRQVH